MFHSFLHKKSKNVSWWSPLNFKSSFPNWVKRWMTIKSLNQHHEHISLSHCIHHFLNGLNYSLSINRWQTSKGSNRKNVEKDNTKNRNDILRHIFVPQMKNEIKRNRIYIWYWNSCLEFFLEKNLLLQNVHSSQSKQKRVKGFVDELDRSTIKQSRAERHFEWIAHWSQTIDTEY